MPDHIAAEFRLAEFGIDRDQHEVKLERVAGIHLDPAVGGRQRGAGRHLHHMRHFEPRLETFRQQMEIAMRDGDEFDPIERWRGPLRSATVPAA